jgi:hypothetical protein
MLDSSALQLPKHCRHSACSMVSEHITDQEDRGSKMNQIFGNGIHHIQFGRLYIHRQKVNHGIN